MDNRIVSDQALELPVTRPFPKGNSGEYESYWVIFTGEPIFGRSRSLV
jgi:hypothetical protein